MPSVISDLPRGAKKYALERVMYQKSTESLSVQFVCFNQSVKREISKLFGLFSKVVYR